MTKIESLLKDKLVKMMKKGPSIEVTKDKSTEEDEDSDLEGVNMEETLDLGA
jgi:hypothetical protein